MQQIPLRSRAATHSSALRLIASGLVGVLGAIAVLCNGGTRTKTRSVSQEALNGGQACDDASEQTEECNLQPCSDIWTAGDNAEIAADGVTFTGGAAGAVVTSQAGVESVSVKNVNVVGSVQMGLATDAAGDFSSGQSVTLPYEGAEDGDVITVGSQHGHAKVYINENPTPVADLGRIGQSVMAKFILDDGASVTVDGIVTPPPALVLEDAAVPAMKSIEQTTAPNGVWLAAIAAVSMSMMVAIARRSRSVPE